MEKMERLEIKVSSRDDVGKEAARRARNKGFIPAVVYGENTNAVLNVPVNSMKTLRAIHFSENTIIDMATEGNKGGKPIPVFIKAVQYHPLTDQVIHIDFLKVSLEKKIKVHVPIILNGEPKGVKEEGGILDQVLRELEVEGLPLDVPENINIDISDLVIGHSLHVSDIVVADNVTIVNDFQTPVVTVVAKKEEPEPEDEILGEAVTGEPEVIKEKKDDVKDGEEPKDEKQGK